MLEIHLLGGVSVTSNQSWLPLELGPHGRQLLGFLFEFPNRPHRRDMLIDRIWWDVDPDRARRSFNTVLWRLRKLLGISELERKCTRILGSKHEVFLELASSTWVDTVAFRESLSDLSAGQAMDRSAETLIPRLFDAFRTYRGPFMDGESADWIIEERERLHSLYVRTGTQLVRLLGGDGCYADAIDIAKQILLADPYREGLHCDLVLLLIANGQRAEAIQIQESMEKRLRSELGIAPMPETSALAEMIKTNAIFDKLDGLMASRWSR
jgi:DNA-binding SARP family transcriptional activator